MGAERLVPSSHLRLPGNTCVEQIREYSGNGLNFHTREKEGK